jgi:hypothetical protein
MSDETSELQQLRIKLAGMALRAELQPKLQSDYASVMAERHRDRVTLLPTTGEPDPISVAAIAQEIIAAADSKWHLPGSVGAGGGPNVYDEIRREMKEAAEREERERQHRQQMMTRAGGR